MKSKLSPALICILGVGMTPSCGFEGNFQNFCDSVFLKCPTNPSPSSGSSSDGSIGRDELLNAAANRLI